MRLKLAGCLAVIAVVEIELRVGYKASLRESYLSSSRLASYNSRLSCLSCETCRRISGHLSKDRQILDRISQAEHGPGRSTSPCINRVQDRVRYFILLRILLCLVSTLGVLLHGVEVKQLLEVAVLSLEPSRSAKHHQHQYTSQKDSFHFHLKFLLPQ